MQIATADRINGVEEYYFSNKLQELDYMRKNGIDVINLGIGSPDMTPSSAAIRRLNEESIKHENHGYQSYRGIPELRKAFADWYKRYFDVHLDPAHEILPLMGSKEGIMHISMAFVNPGDEVLIPNPGYPAYESATRLCGGLPRQYSLHEETGWFPDLRKLEEEGLQKVKLMWVNYPHMPTGTRASVELLSELVAFGVKHKILICNDNPYSFILNDHPISILSIRNSMSSCLELNSLSKSHNMAGWRIGMVAGQKELINAVLKVKSNMDSGMFRPLQLAAVDALSSPESWYKEQNEIYRKRQMVAFDIMDAMNCCYDRSQTGLFVWGKIPGTFTQASGLSDKLLRETAVFITPGFIFGSRGADYLRISLCSDESRLETAKTRIMKVMK